MRNTMRSARLAIPLILAAGTLSAQSAATDYRDEFLAHFEQSSYKIAELAKAMPAEKYEWSPGAGVMPVAQVYMHLARYNFMYLDQNLGIAPPHGVDYSGLEAISDKDEVQRIFARSVEHVNDAVGRMSEEDLVAETTLYGRRVAGWAVLFQLLSHMNEHVGQSVAYARMNGVVPPWSR